MKPSIQLRLTVMNFLQFAIWGAYLTSMGRYLGAAGFGSEIGNFYAMQGFVSLFMPALMGIVADRWIPAQRLLGLCHAVAGALMMGVFLYTQTEAPSYTSLFVLYSLSVAFYMPTLALSNSVAYTSLEQSGLDLVKSFPPIRVFGTVGFICTMITVSLLGLEATSGQFAVSGIIGLVLAVYSQTLPHCPTAPKGQSKSLVEALGLRAFVLFKQRKMALFFISLSQLSETLCILLIPFALRRFGIRRVMLIAMTAWVLRFALLGLGDPGSGVWLFLLSMVVYGVAFDFFNVSGSLFVDKETDPSIRSSAQGLFMIMTNGIGATLGSLGAQAVINHFVSSQTETTAVLAGWSMSWYIFAGYSAVVAVLFAVLFRYKTAAE